MLNRAILGGSVILSNPEDGAGDNQANDGRNEDIDCAEVLARSVREPLREHLNGDEIKGDTGKYCRGNQSLVKRRHNFLACAKFNEISSDNGGDDGNAAKDQRVVNSAAVAGKGNGAEQHGSDQGNGICFKQVGSHTGAVTDVVTDVIGDNSWVTGVIFRDPGLDFSNQVGADIGALGENAAAETGEDGDQ